MDTLLGIGALWVAAATAITLGLARAAALDESFRLDADRMLTR
ncbi:MULTISPECIES: hypothetical protein [unclassified Nocardioides]|jgi:hypothetical protein|nr:MULTISPECIES: hypothetical protein [unclassified Nocardioides]